MQFNREYGVGSVRFCKCRADVQRVAINLGAMIDELGRASVFPPQLHLNLHDGVGGDARMVRVPGSTIT